MRFCEDLVILKSIVHIIDKNGDEPILGSSLMDIDEETYNYLYNHIIKVLGSDNNSKGVFFNDEGIVLNAAKNIIFDGDFIEESRKIAKFLFKILKKNPDGLSGDLVILELVIDDKRTMGILLLEYKTSFVHDINFQEDSFFVGIKPQTISLPPKGQKLSRCAFINEFDNDDCNLIMLEKSNLDESGERVEYFVKDFLNASVVLDNYDISKIFRDQTEKWIRKSLKSEIGTALDIRNEIDDIYINSVDVDIPEVVGEITSSIDEKEKILMDLEKKGIDIDEKFEIDKRFVNKKFKQKNIKTDTGFSIKGEFDLFQNSSLFEIKNNGDGTVNYIIKGVRNIKQL